MSEVEIPSRTVLYLRSAVYWLGMVLSAGVIGLLTVLTFPLHVDRRFRFAQSFARFNLWLIEKVCKLSYEVEGLDEIPQSGAVVLCKHQSTWETLMLQIDLPSVRWVLKKELLMFPFFGWGLALMKPIAIDRSSGRRAVTQMIEQGREMLKDGYWVVVFPEGTRAKPGEQKRYKAGGAMLAVETGFPVVPIAHNAGEYWPRHSFIKWPGRIKVCVGPVIDPRGKTADEVNAESSQWIENKMQEISDPVRWNR
ncbi:MAG: lysophospholipid acyltransferase family protein [Gammaproteobacteria bacterium]|nr:lysophospholipid acyltransferase family protein [Gammaproteobacteria bacterium]